MNEEKIKNQAREFLFKNKLCALSTTAPGNRPEVSTVLYMADDDMNFYFVTRRQTRKFKNLLSNKNVALVIGVELSPFNIQAEGEAEPLEGKDQEIFMEKFMERPDLQELYFGPFLKVQGTDFAIFRVKTKWLRFMQYDRETGDEKYTQIIG